MKKYETIFQQSERINTVEAYKERDKIYKAMNFGEIINLINEVEEITTLIATNSHEFHLSSAEISAIGNSLKSMDEIADCLTIISKLRSIKNK